MTKLIEKAIEEQEQRVFREQDHLVHLQGQLERYGKKHKVRITNEDYFRDLIDGESMVVAMARTLLTTKCDEIIKQKEQVIADHQKGIISGEYIVHCTEMILKVFKDEE